MITFKRILFPVEFSPHCQAAGRYVALYARHFDAEVVLLHVEELPLEPYVWESQSERLAERLDQFLVDEFSGLKVQRLVRTGDPASEIAGCVNNEKIDLIMMPTHGRGLFRRFVLGSVTAKVLHDAPCPVWTSAHLDAQPSSSPAGLSSIACAVDLDEAGEQTVRFAGNFARSVGAKLTIVHAVPAVENLPEANFDAEFREDLMDTARTHLAEMQALAGVEAVASVGTGNIARFVSRAAQSQNADLVIIGRGGNGVMGRLRTHDYAIIRECECPVLSI